MRLPRLSQAVDLAVSAAGSAVGTAAAVVALPGRVIRLVDGAEVVLARAAAALDAADEAIREVRTVTAAAAGLMEEARGVSSGAATIVVQAARTATAADAIVVQAARTATAADAIVAQAEQTAANADVVVAQAARTATTADELLTAYDPPLRRFVENLSAEEVTAAIRMIDELPRLAHHLNTDVMPILATLDRVGPDIHELLNVTRDLRQAIVGLPGFAMFRRRGEKAETESDAT
ncbi:hypothetical protein [Dactylosporangium sp. NPDC049140]|uniref:hypothetical protein n=1 Tax=Dactylosporangium sp. NPDC049140 TaxID=3155647 RepID=UPI00340796BC